jgi:hypothetical protein
MNAPLNLTQLANPFDAWFAPIPKLDGKSLMDHLYNRLDGAYPHKWRSNFSTPESIDNWKVSWAEAFEDEGIAPNDIAAGLRACRSRYDWPPSCAEFIKACKPSVDPLVAYYEAAAGIQAREKGELGTWSHPAIFWAAASMAYDLKHQGYTAIKARWEKALAEQMEKGEWAAIPAVLLALPEPGKTKADREHAEKMIAEIGASSIVKSQQSDHRRWISKVLERQKRKDDSLPSVAVRMANDALKECRA